MINSSEEIEDRDDFEYPITTLTDEEGDYNASSNDGGEADNDPSRSMEPRPNINSQLNYTWPQSTNENETEQQQYTNGVENDANANPTLLGREFVSEEEADTCYRDYARKIGFGVRRHNKRRNVNSKITGRTWVYSREGFRPAKRLEKRSK